MSASKPCFDPARGREGRKGRDFTSVRNAREIQFFKRDTELLSLVSLVSPRLRVPGWGSLFVVWVLPGRPAFPRPFGTIGRVTNLSFLSKWSWSYVQKVAFGVG
jgi:hypothetical protein